MLYVKTPSQYKNKCQKVITDLKSFQFFLCGMPAYMCLQLNDTTTYFSISSPCKPSTHNALNAGSSHIGTQFYKLLSAKRATRK